MKHIAINCHTGQECDIENLVQIQGELKELSVENRQKLKREITESGFNFAPSVWVSGSGGKGAYHLIDGHQRIEVMKELKKEGWEFGAIPFVKIDAQNMDEAKRMVLQAISQYGRVTNNGLSSFMGTFNFQPPDLKQFYIPNINIDKFLNKPQVVELAEEVEKGRFTTMVHECPKCGFSFGAKK